jgi:hypothetical protein
MSVDIATQPNFVFSKPMALPIDFLYTPAGTGRPYDVMTDGKQFVEVFMGSTASSEVKPSPQINVVFNWFTELQERVPVK